MTNASVKISGVALVSVLSAAVLWAEDEQYAFMPDGGRSILIKLMDGLSPEDAAELLTRNATADEWLDWASAVDADLDEAATETFAGYAALNFPLEETPDSGLSLQDLMNVLPADGKDLAISQCQFCHSLFSSYLTHDRDEAGWKSTFKAPFHAEIPMSEVERDTFAKYSAINMPLAFEDVPPELRF